MEVLTLKRRRLIKKEQTDYGSLDLSYGVLLLMIVVLYSKMFVGSSIQTPPSYFDIFGIAKLSQVEAETHLAKNHPERKSSRLKT